jgi:very-short-patch-repair endonuclease
MRSVRPGDDASERGTSDLAVERETPLGPSAELHLSELRRRLLDLRGVNRLIHFPHAEHGKSFIRVVDEIPETLHRKLVEGRTLRVLPLPASLAEPTGGDELADTLSPEVEPEPLEELDPPAPSSPDVTALAPERVEELPAPERVARLLGIDPRLELPLPSEQNAGSHRDDAVQTLLYPELHQKILANIADVTRSAREEQGIHTLFAAFGFVEWYERADSDVARFAPLVLQPLALARERRPGRYQYAIAAHDEQPEVNLALSERFFRDFGFRLPAWEEDDQLGAYLARVVALIGEQPRWKLHRWVTISNFSFARIAMYHDLDEARWPNGQAPHTHATFRALTSDRTGGVATRWDDESEELPALADALPSLILDADTSQVAAVLEAMEPRNLVIKGPPGTGKSQTIANLIAAALRAGQRVLFVAEKQAALEVVKARLDRAGLGPFCLELHSQRATRKAVMEALSKRLELRERAPAKLAGQTERARMLRCALNEYVTALNTTHGSLGYTVHELIWRRERARSAVAAFLPPLDKLRMPGALTLRLEQLDPLRHGLKGLCQVAQDRERAFAEDEGSIWLLLDQPEIDEEQLLGRLEAYQARLLAIRAVVQEKLGPSAKTSLDLRRVSALSALAHELPAGAELRAGLIKQLDAEGAEGLRAALALLQARAALLTELSPACRNVQKALAALPELRAAAALLSANTTPPPAAQRRAGSKLGARASTLGAALTQARERARRSQELTSLQEQAARLVEFAELGAAEDATCVLSLRDALHELETVPRALLQVLRSAPLTKDAGELGALSTLARETAELRSRRDACYQRLEPGSHEPELRRRGADYALALRRTPWLAWLFAAFWGARRLYARIARGSRPSARGMADELLEATRMLDALERFAARDDARRLAGETFAGADTDFALLLQAAEWAHQIRRQHARMHPAAAALQRLALDDDLVRVDTLLAEARQLELEPLWLLAERAKSAAQLISPALAAEQEAARAAHGALEQLLRGGLSEHLRADDLARRLLQLSELTRIETELTAQARALERFGLGEDLSALHLDELASTLDAYDRALAHGIPKVLLASLASPETRRTFALALSEPLRGEAEERAALAAFGLREDTWQALSASLVECLAAVETALTTRPLLRAQLRYLRELARAKTTPARHVVEAYARGTLPVDKLVEACEYVLFQALIEHACEEQPALQHKNGRELESMRTQFQALDRELLGLHAKAIAATLSQAEVPEGTALGKKSEWSELALIRNELSKKQRHVPLRQLLRRASGALRGLKPCFMMSPLTVAQYLPQEPDQFDLVVIDEASQMRPEDAMGAIVRARRAVVVGDPQQLPPTSFFQRLESTEDEHEEGEDEAIEQESILDLCVASFGGACDLRWHYRSRHPSLIAFSNEHFYDSRLKVFPAPVRDRGDLGVTLVKVEGEYASSLNQLEAERIALGVLRHVRLNRQASLGVVAMNHKQKELIAQKIYELGDESVRAFVDAQNSAQPFFVKSLENVQGDERDVIFVSMTYGPEPGSKKVMQRFGPLNSQHGARRLNVLFTRARERLVVYSSLGPEDVRVDESSSAGLKILRKYLAYAAQSEAPAEQAALASESPFEDAVREVLEQAGFSVAPRVGVQGFFIDLAVHAPDGRGFACGIECDGPRYHAQRSTRDRDRLRQEVLEAQGWKLLRVWSTDWFRAPQVARERLIASVRACCNGPTEVLEASVTPLPIRKARER